MIAVDSSVWIDHFNQVDSAPATVLHELIEVDATIGIVDVCLTEILQGFRRERDVDLVTPSLLSFRVLPTVSVTDHLLAAELYRAARRRGRTVPATIACIIAAVCVREQAVLLHNDRDFDQLAGCTPLRVMAV